MVGLCKHATTMAFVIVLVVGGVRSSTAQVVVRAGARSVRSRAVVKAAAQPGDEDDFMTLTLSGGVVNFGLVPGRASNPGTGSITINTSWGCPCDTPTFELYAYFNSPTVALTDGAGDNIPPSAVSISDNGGAFQALNGTQPFGAANSGLHLVSIPATGGQGGGRHTDSLNFNINLSTGTLSNLPPGTYTGTLTIQGQAQ
jgi:hypothetical protein